MLIKIYYKYLKNYFDIKNILNFIFNFYYKNIFDIWNIFYKFCLLIYLYINFLILIFINKVFISFILFYF